MKLCRPILFVKVGETGNFMNGLAVIMGDGFTYCIGCLEDVSLQGWGNWLWQGYRSVLGWVSHFSNKAILKGFEWANLYQNFGFDHKSGSFAVTFLETVQGWSTDNFITSGAAEFAVLDGEPSSGCTKEGCVHKWIIPIKKKSQPSKKKPKKKKPTIITAHHINLTHEKKTLKNGSIRIGIEHKRDRSY